MGWHSGVGAESCGRQPGLEDRYRMPHRGVVLEKWPGGTDEKVGEGWPGLVKCVYTLRIRSAHRICRGLEPEPGCGGEGQLCVVPHRFGFLALHGRHSKTHAGHVEKSGSDQRDTGDTRDGRKDLRICGSHVLMNCNHKWTICLHES